MGEIRYIKSTKDDLERLMQIRMEMLNEVNHLPEDYVYGEILLEESRKYFETGNQTTILAIDGGETVGCASLSYIRIMPTFSHPTGKRAHLMNVYTRPEYRRMGIAKEMIELLIAEAKEQGATEISLDATELGRPLYEALGFTASDSCMAVNLR